MKRRLLVCALAAVLAPVGNAEFPTTMHEDELDGYNGSITLSLNLRTMIPRSEWPSMPANELWQHYHQVDHAHFIEAYGASKSVSKTVSGVNVRGCEVGPTDTIHIYFTRKNKLGKWSTPNLGGKADIEVSQTLVTNVGAKVPAHRELAAREVKKNARDLHDSEVHSGLNSIGKEHVVNVDWIWKVALNDSNYQWSPGVTASGRYETSIKKVSGDDEDWRMADVVVKGPNASQCSFTLAECGYFRLHRNKETKSGGLADIRKLQRPLNKRCRASNPGRAFPGGSKDMNGTQLKKK